MNYTKEQRRQMKDGYDPQTAWNKLIEDCDELEKELAASRDSRILSAVPSELLSAIMSVRKINTPEWLEFIVEEMNKALEKIGDADRVYYDQQRDIIRKRGIAG